MITAKNPQQASQNPVSFNNTFLEPKPQQLPAAQPAAPPAPPIPPMPGR